METDSELCRVNYYQFLTPKHLGIKQFPPTPHKAEDGMTEGALLPVLCTLIALLDAALCSRMQV